MEVRRRITERLEALRHTLKDKPSTLASFAIYQDPDLLFWRTVMIYFNHGPASATLTLGLVRNNNTFIGKSTEVEQDAKAEADSCCDPRTGFVMFGSLIQPKYISIEPNIAEDVILTHIRRNICALIKINKLPPSATGEGLISQYDANGKLINTTEQVINRFFPSFYKASIQEEVDQQIFRLVEETRTTNYSDLEESLNTRLLSISDLRNSSIRTIHCEVWGYAIQTLQDLLILNNKNPRAAITHASSSSSSSAAIASSLSSSSSSAPASSSSSSATVSSLASSSSSATASSSSSSSSSFATTVPSSSSSSSSVAASSSMPPASELLSYRPR